MIFSYARLLTIVFWVFILILLPLPAGYEMARPLWGVLMLLYIQFKLPDVFNYGWIVLLGIILDILSLAPLGDHIFALCLVAGISSNRALRFKFFSAVQQVIWIFFLVLIYQVTLTVIDCFLGHRLMMARTCIPIIISTLIWPIFAMFVDRHLLRAKKSVLYRE